MQQAVSSKAFFVTVEGQSHSNHRSPKGVYKVEVIAEKTMAHSACAAISVARRAVPFLDENPHGFVVRAFSEDGSEVVIPRLLHTENEENGFFCGRAVSYPDAITLQ